MQIEGEEWDRELTEICFEHRGDAANVVEAIRVKEIKRRVVPSFKELCNALCLGRTTSLPVDTFVVQSESVDGVDALLNDDGDIAIFGVGSCGVCVNLFDEIPSKHRWGRGLGGLLLSMGVIVRTRDLHVGNASNVDRRGTDCQRR